MRQVNGFPMTMEQNEIIDSVLGSDDNLLVKAYAGASKSTTSQQLAKEYRGNVLYTTFNNRNIKEAAKSFPHNVACRTNNSLAWGVGSIYSVSDRLPAFINPDIVVSKLKLKDIRVDPFKIQKREQAFDILTMVRNFCNSEDDIIGLHHGDTEFMFHGVDDKIDNYHITYYAFLLPKAQRLWELMNNPKSDMPITHDVYLKIWCLKKPKLRYKLIIGDEFQDVNAAFAKVIREQDSQLVIVGDEYQALYGWRGATDSLEKMGIDKRLYLSKSFRFGPQIADLSSDVLSHHLGKDVGIEGFEKANTEVWMEDSMPVSKRTILCRTNAMCVKYLAENMRSGLKVKMVVDVHKMISYIKGIMALRSRRPAYGPLSVFDSYRDLVDYSKTSAGGEIGTLINVLNFCSKTKLSVPDLIGILRDSSHIRDPDIIISTTHKFKGLEADNVFLGDDFKHRDDDSWTNEDANLLYVAVSRARKHLDVSRCSAVRVIYDDSFAKEKEDEG